MMMTIAESDRESVHACPPAVVPVLYHVILVRRRGEGGVKDGPDVAQAMSFQLCVKQT